MSAPVQENLAAIKARMEAACLRSGRSVQELTLVAVTKFVSQERILEASRAGLTNFAESRQQEAREKLPGLRGLGTWHFIGHLQSNKAGSVAELFDVVQSLDSLALAEKLSRSAQELGKCLGVFAQVNISAEPQKYGFALEGAQAQILKIRDLPGLQLSGLMGMAAAGLDPESARRQFRALKELSRRLGGLPCSMGMSQDFEAAIEEGADLIRIGGALFK